jgi:hypothetical protein
MRESIIRQPARGTRVSVSRRARMDMVRGFVTIVAITSALMLPRNTAFAQTPDPKSLSAQ